MILNRGFKEQITILKMVANTQFTVNQRQKKISAIFKISYGLSLDRFNFNFTTFLEEYEKLLEPFKNENTINVA